MGHESVHGPVTPALQVMMMMMMMMFGDCTSPVEHRGAEIDRLSLCSVPTLILATQQLPQHVRLDPVTPQLSTAGL